MSSSAPRQFVATANDLSMLNGGVTLNVEYNCRHKKGVGWSAVINSWRAVRLARFPEHATRGNMIREIPNRHANGTPPRENCSSGQGSNPSNNVRRCGFNHEIRSRATVVPPLRPPNLESEYQRAGKQQDNSNCSFLRISVVTDTYHCRCIQLNHRKFKPASPQFHAQ